jgi:hypothetical protein
MRCWRRSSWRAPIRSKPSKAIAVLGNFDWRSFGRSRYGCATCHELLFMPFPVVSPGF